MTDAAALSVPTAVDFWFDPSCPWAWMTSRWVDEVAPHRDLAVTWHVMSLAVLNENNEQSDGQRAFLPRALRYTRLIAAAQELHGNSVIKGLYDALGTRIHNNGRDDADSIIAEALDQVGLPSTLAAHADTDEYDLQMRLSHATAIARVGADVGTPVIALGDYAFFGPVISPAPTGDAAVSLWDGVVALAAYDGFFELKRSRTRGPVFS